MSLNINSMLFYGRHRNRLLNWQRNRRDSPPGAAEYQEQSWAENRRARSQPSPCWRGPRFRPSLNYNRRLQASQAHHLDGRHLLASPSSIFRTTASTFLCLHTPLLYSKCYRKCKLLQELQGFSLLPALSALSRSLHHNTVTLWLWVLYCRWRANIKCCITEMINQGRAERPGRVESWEWSRFFHWSVSPLYLSGWSCLNKWNHLVFLFDWNENRHVLYSRAMWIYN